MACLCQASGLAVILQLMLIGETLLSHRMQLRKRLNPDAYAYICGKFVGAALSAAAFFARSEATLLASDLHQPGPER